MHLLEINKEHKSLLASIRNWENVKIAFTETSIWLKDFTAEQLNSSSLLQIPFLKIYEVKNNLLFPKGSLLPAKKVPSALLWTNLQKALPVILPSFNHNYFGIHENINVNIVPSENEKQAYAMLTSIQNAKEYIENAPNTRLQKLKWIILENKILFIGKPLLPIKGKTFWLQNNSLIPTGYNFELPILHNIIENKIDNLKENIIFWQNDGTYILLPKTNFQELSISSFRLTL